MDIIIKLMLKLVMYIHSTGDLVLLYIIIINIYEEMLVKILVEIGAKIEIEVKMKIINESKKAIGKEI